jgi:hypothetical protein
MGCYAVAAMLEEPPSVAAVTTSRARPIASMSASRVRAPALLRSAFLIVVLLRRRVRPPRSGERGGNGPSPRRGVGFSPPKLEERSGFGVDGLGGVRHRRTDRRSITGFPLAARRGSTFVAIGGVRGHRGSHRGRIARSVTRIPGSSQIGPGAKTESELTTGYGKLALVSC